MLFRSERHRSHWLVGGGAELPCIASPGPTLDHLRGAEARGPRIGDPGEPANPAGQLQPLEPAEVRGQRRGRHLRSLPHHITLFRPLRDGPIAAKMTLLPNRHGEDAVRLRAAFEHAPMCVAVLTPDGRLLNINPAGAALFDRDAESLLGCNFDDLVHVDDRRLFLDVDRKSTRLNSSHSSVSRMPSSA